MTFFNSGPKGLHEVFQANNFLLIQKAPFAAGQVFLGEAGVLHAVEGHHVVAEVLENAAHNAVAAYVQLDAHEVRVASHYGYVIHLRLAIFQLQAKQIMEKLAGKTGSLEDLAKIAGNGAVVQTAEGAAQAQGTIPNVGFEPDAVGRAFALKPGQKSAPIQGEQGVLVVEPTGVFPATPSDLKVVRQQLAQQRQQRQDGLIYEAIKGKAKVQDNRSKFF